MVILNFSSEKKICRTTQEDHTTAILHRKSRPAGLKGKQNLLCADAFHVALRLLAGPGLARLAYMEGWLALDGETGDAEAYFALRVRFCWGRGTQSSCCFASVRSLTAADGLYSLYVCVC